MPIAQRSGAPVLLINLQPTESMDHATFDTGQWLAYCGACPLPEMANTFERCGHPRSARSPATSRTSAPGQRIGRWIKAAGVRGALRHGRHGLMGHLYPGMLDVSTDLTLVTAHLGGHVEVLEFDDLRVRVEAVTDDRGRSDASSSPARSSSSTTASTRTTSRGPRGSRSASTGSSTTSPSTRSPTTTAASTARSTSGSAPG